MSYLFVSTSKVGRPNEWQFLFKGYSNRSPLFCPLVVKAQNMAAISSSERYLCCFWHCSFNLVREAASRPNNQPHLS